MNGSTVFQNPFKEFCFCPGTRREAAPRLKILAANHSVHVPIPLSYYKDNYHFPGFKGDRRKSWNQALRGRIFSALLLIPKKGNGLKVEHSTQFLKRLVEEGRLKLSLKIQKKVTYHDPCYLGRRSGVFEEPRKLIEMIPGVTFVEMEKFGKNSDCCGMGGGRMWMELPKGFVRSQPIAERRVKQALDTGAEILLTACPFCRITLGDAIKAMKAEESLRVMDIAEWVAQMIA